MDKLRTYFKESYHELVNKVTWPTWKNLLANTRLVIVASVILALLVFLMDALSKTVLDQIYGL